MMLYDAFYPQHIVAPCWAGPGFNRKRALTERTGETKLIAINKRTMNTLIYNDKPH